MITDAEFWMEVRRKDTDGDAIFKCMLSLLHARQAKLAMYTHSLAREEFKITSRGMEMCDTASGTVPSAEECIKREAIIAQRRHELIGDNNDDDDNGIYEDEDEANHKRIVDARMELERKAREEERQIRRKERFYQMSQMPNIHSDKLSKQQEEENEGEEVEIESNTTLITLRSGNVSDSSNVSIHSNTHSKNNRNRNRQPCVEHLLETNKALNLPHTPPRRVAPITIRVLEQVMLFAIPVYALRYNIPAMSMSWETSCCVDNASKQLITFGAGNGVNVPPRLYARGCVAGEGYFAILTDRDEVWASGKLELSSAIASSAKNARNALGGGNNTSGTGNPQLMNLSSNSISNINTNNNNNNKSNDDANNEKSSKQKMLMMSSSGATNKLVGIAGRTLMLVGHGDRLASVTNAFTVRPLSALSTTVRSLIPSRRVRFIDVGYGDELYMVGVDSTLYKATASRRSIGTPRRVMSMCHVAVSRVACGSGFLLIIDQNGHLLTMGNNKTGQLGIGKRREARRSPFVHWDLAHHFFTQVAAGDRHGLALTSSGVVYGAGNNEVGQLGLGEHTECVCMFTPIPLPCRCIGIATGPAGSMFACEDGSVLACGMNGSRQLGVDSHRRCVFSPSPISLLQEGVVSYAMDFGGYRKVEMAHMTPTPSQMETELSRAPTEQLSAFVNTSSNEMQREPSMRSHTETRREERLKPTMDEFAPVMPLKKVTEANNANTTISATSNIANNDNMESNKYVANSVMNENKEHMHAEVEMLAKPSEENALTQTVTATAAVNNTGNDTSNTSHEPYKPLENKIGFSAPPDRHEPILVESSNSKKNYIESNNYTTETINAPKITNVNTIGDVNYNNVYNNIDHAAQNNNNLSSDAFRTNNANANSPIKTTTITATTSILPATSINANVVNPSYNVYANNTEQPMSLFTPATINNVRTDNTYTNEPVQRVLHKPQMIMIDSSANAAGTVPVINDNGRYKVNAHGKKARCGGCCTMM